MGKFIPGDMAYIVENGSSICECEVVRVSGEFYIIKYRSVNSPSENAIIQLRGSRLFATREDAKKIIKERSTKIRQESHRKF